MTMTDAQVKSAPLETATQVPVLITWDVDRYNPTPYLRSVAWERRVPKDIDRYNREVAPKRKTLQAALELCREFEIPATFFFVAKEAVFYPEEIIEMKHAGHEIGCHGLFHSEQEAYDRMPQDMQRNYIEQATRLLEEQTGTSLTAFRGPRVKVSSTTLKLLVEYGYLSDSSVCSQRVDFLSSNLVNPGWLAAPRKPYHPHKDNAFKRGDLNILEVPVSAMMLPFISTTLYMFKLPVMKILFRLLYAEARRTGKPIVYLAHPLEFGVRDSYHFKLSDLSPKSLRAVGLKGRKRLGTYDPESCLNLNRALFSFMAAFPGIRFMTMREYTLHFNKSAVTSN